MYDHDPFIGWEIERRQGRRRGNVAIHEHSVGTVGVIKLDG
jgi:hypothetical protein